jgi:hypothetical protein
MEKWQVQPEKKEHFSKPSLKRVKNSSLQKINVYNNYNNKREKNGI